MQVVKRDAPKIYRQFQADVFTELSIYKQKIVSTMQRRLIETSYRLTIASQTQDAKVGTKISDVKDNIVRVYKLDEFGFMIGVDLPEQANVEL